MNRINTQHTWEFQRMGALHQVILKSAEDIKHLDQLDAKLWVALSCPASGLEFDERTLALLDEDKDNRIRIPEVISAVKWTIARLKHVDTLMQCLDELPLDAICTQTPEGARLHATAKAILANLNKPEATFITQDDVQKSTVFDTQTLFNGDGILAPIDKLDADIQAFINDAMLVMGSLKDAGGLQGIDQKVAEAFIKSMQEWLSWRDGVGSASTPLGDNTAEVWNILQAIEDKVNDYFLRCELASYAPQAETALNVDEKFIVPAENGILADQALAELPLSKIEADRPLHLDVGLNPIWRDQVVRFGQLVQPFIADPKQLTRQEWLNIQALLKPYATAVTSRPQLVKVEVTTPPKGTIDQLGEARIKEILNSDVAQRFATIADKDSKTPAAAADVAEVERLVIYHKHLYRLLMNFVSFEDFFNPQRTAAFQAGKLFIDGRCCSLCIPVTDLAKHPTLATYSELFLLYCDCVRKPQAGSDEQEKMTIVAAMTAGNSSLLLEGRNGVFIDNHGNDWDAKVVKVIIKPISIGQAVLDPYRRIGRFISDQISKWATAKESAVLTSGTKALQSLGSKTTTGTLSATDAASKMDISRSVGIFAAIGLALGAIGTALASLAHALLALSWWQFPLVFLALFIIISGPSVILAWIKLRQRTLGPLLEASGWAINGRVKINFMLGRFLTSKAQLPADAHKIVNEPLKRNRKPLIALLLALIIGAAAGSWLWYHKEAIFAPTTKTKASKIIEPTKPAAPEASKAAETTPAKHPATPAS